MLTRDARFRGNDVKATRNIISAHAGIHNHANDGDAEMGLLTKIHLHDLRVGLDLVHVALRQHGTLVQHGDP